MNILTIQLNSAMIYAVKREYFTGSERKRNEPSGSFQLERDWRVTTAKSVADKEPKEPLVSQTTTRLHRCSRQAANHVAPRS
jgi:hypothetical protein